MLLLIAATSSLFYFVFVVAIVNRLQDSMLTTLVGHEIDEIVTELVIDPSIKMPKTASVQAFLLSREDDTPIPDFLRKLTSTVHSEVSVGDKIYHAVVLDVHNDRIFLAFEMTEIYKNSQHLLKLLIGGGILTVCFLLMGGIWLSKKFLSPVSNLAEELANINPNERNIRIEKEYRDYEVGLIAHSFDQFMKRMDDYVEREQSFTAAISHELRTPVAVIGTSIDLLELKGISDQQKGAFKRIKVSTDYMAQVIESLLFFARNFYDKVDQSLPAIKLSHVCKKILKQYEELAADKKLTLEFNKEFETKVRILDNHIEIILGNLVRNAINNTEQGRVIITENENGFSVTDTGRGMQQVEIDFVMEKSKKVPLNSTSGLGLYLVTNICRYYGLKLEVESSLGKGTQFSVIFPQQLRA